MFRFKLHSNWSLQHRLPLLHGSLTEAALMPSWEKFNHSHNVLQYDFFLMSLEAQRFVFPGWISANQLFLETKVGFGLFYNIWNNVRRLQCTAAFKLSLLSNKKRFFSCPSLYSVTRRHLCLPRQSRPPPSSSSSWQLWCCAPIRCLQRWRHLDEQEPSAGRHGSLWDQVSYRSNHSTSFNQHGSQSLLNRH